MLYVCRSFFIAILCGSLLFLDFSSKGVEIKNTYAEEISDSNLGATLTMAATGLVASRLYSYPKLTPDMIAAAVGGGAFIAGEIAAYLQFKDQLKDFEDDLVRNEKGNLDEKQIESLEKLLQSYEKAKETAGMKKGFQMAAAAAFAVATALATYQALTEKNTEVACLSGVKTAISSGYAACKAAWYKSCAPGCASSTAGAAVCTKACAVAGSATDCEPCELSQQNKFAQLMARIGGRETPSPSMSAMTNFLTLSSTIKANDAASCIGTFSTGTMKTPSVAACAPYEGVLALNTTGGLSIAANVTSLTPAPENSVFKNKLLVYLYEKLLVSSRAGTFSSPLSMMGITSSVAISFVMANYVSVANFVDFNILIPARRALIWAAMTLTTTMAISATSAVEERLEGNIQKIRSILNRMYQLNPAGFAKKPNLVDALKKNIPLAKRISSIPLTNNIITENVKYDYTKNLACLTALKNDKCEDMNSSVQKLEGVSNLPAELRKQFNDVTDFGSTINGSSSISAAAIEGSQKLGSQSNAINERMRSERIKIQEIINKNSTPDRKIDFEKGEEEARKALFNSTRDALKANKLTEEKAFRLIGGGINSVGVKSEAVASVAPKKNDKDAKAVTIAVGSEKKKDEKAEDLDLGLGEDAEKEIAAVEDLNPEAGGEAPKTIDDYDLGQNIHKDPQQNLFDIISKRYMSSGYKRLLEKKKSDAAKAVK